MKYYRYRSISVIIMRMVGNILLLIGIMFSPLIPLAIYRVIINYPDSVIPKDGFFVLGLIIFLLLFGLVFSNLFPNLAVDDRGLYVSFYFRWLLVPWENVVSFQERVA